ncbi:aldehyde dehydrogenase family protein [Mumia sp. zg.B53]|uniref:aldehyde dehydrogenase family protein n=1 Tax=Mumia sp. zg.B53 TaxID=2855449 RepID=UPI001C6EC8D5|nr:aldehyde dehydrogenase family protein [Mumia sp. zg.B53]MBW9216382.1 aldehyde dehydrogenase family protein [Mumia sp. zg.B53]
MSGAATTPRENPARTTEIVGETPVASAAEVDVAVARARFAQAGWVVAAPADRAATLRAAAELLEPGLDDLAVLMARETGKPLADCRGEVGFGVAVLRWAADRGEALLVDHVVDDAEGRLVRRHRPYGVVAAVTPWNAPVVLTMLKVAPALVGGNAVVVKPSPLAPFAVERLLATMGEVLPEGLLQTVHGHADTATALVGHPGVDRVAFTGGDVAGRAIARTAASALTPSLLELGGNDPAILLPDVSLDDGAMDRLVMASFATSGQVCMAVKRLYVHRSRYDEVVGAYREAAARVLRTGDPLHPGVTMGPVVSAASAERVRGLVAGASARGAEVLELGSLDDATAFEGGYFVRPTLVLGAADDDDVVATEQFGPTLPILAFDSEDEVVARANAGELGLGASVWSRDEEHAFAVGARVDAGFTFINTHNRTGLALRAPFGGVKRSGWGREYGDEGVLEHVQTCVLHAPAAFRAGGVALAATAYPS